MLKLLSVLIGVVILGLAPRAEAAGPDIPYATLEASMPTAPRTSWICRPDFLSLSRRGRSEPPLLVCSWFGARSRLEDGS